MYNLFVDRNIDNERGPAIVDDLKRRILVYEFFVFFIERKYENTFKR